MGIMTENMKRCIITISGRVQGVYYRTYAKAAAENNNVAGYAKNLPNGSIEVVVEGDEFDILSFMQILRTGPPNAVIDGFDTEWQPARGEFKGFEIRRD